ncbi:MAG: hypothetical protein ACXADW_02965 [Candidatus Hodarchaeales archaeon]|jgi:hypothetical protein
MINMISCSGTFPRYSGAMNNVIGGSGKFSPMTDVVACSGVFYTIDPNEVEKDDFFYNGEEPDHIEERKALREFNKYCEELENEKNNDGDFDWDADFHRAYRL